MTMESGRLKVKVVLGCIAVSAFAWAWYMKTSANHTPATETTSPAAKLATRPALNVAETREPFTFLIVGTGLTMALAWSRLAGWVARHPKLEAPVRKWSPYLLPVILIVIGWYVLSDTGTDTL